jgi:hypothetical protein
MWTYVCNIVCLFVWCALFCRCSMQKKNLVFLVQLWVMRWKYAGCHLFWLNPVTCHIVRISQVAVCSWYDKNWNKMFLGYYANFMENTQGDADMEFNNALGEHELCPDVHQRVVARPVIWSPGGRSSKWTLVARQVSRSTSYKCQEHTDMWMFG